jgi:hypothetical protein
VTLPHNLVEITIRTANRATCKAMGTERMLGFIMIALGRHIHLFANNPPDGPPDEERIMRRLVDLGELAKLRVFDDETPDAI